MNKTVENIGVFQCLTTKVRDTKINLQLYHYINLQYYCISPISIINYLQVKCLINP